MDNDLVDLMEKVDPKGIPIPDVELVIALKEAAQDRALSLASGNARVYQALDVVVRKYEKELIDRLRRR
jgi:hypothetical protein